MSREAVQDRRFISGNEAVAFAVRLCRPQVIAAYPITPQTTAVERLAEFIEKHELECEYINVESEHSAMAAAMGAAMMGCRTCGDEYAPKELGIQ